MDDDLIGGLATVDPGPGTRRSYRHTHAIIGRQQHHRRRRDLGIFLPVHPACIGMTLEHVISWAGTEMADESHGRLSCQNYYYRLLH